MYLVANHEGSIEYDCPFEKGDRFEVLKTFSNDSGIGYIVKAPVTNPAWKGSKAYERGYRKIDVYADEVEAYFDVVEE